MPLPNLASISCHRLGLYMDIECRDGRITGNGNDRLEDTGIEGMGICQDIQKI